MELPEKGEFIGGALAAEDGKARRGAEQDSRLGVYSLKIVDTNLPSPSVSY